MTPSGTPGTPAVAAFEAGHIATTPSGTQVEFEAEPIAMTPSGTIRSPVVTLEARPIAMAPSGTSGGVSKT